MAEKEAPLLGPVRARRALKEAVARYRAANSCYQRSIDAARRPRPEGAPTMSHTRDRPPIVRYRAGRGNFFTDELLFGLCSWTGLTGSLRGERAGGRSRGMLGENSSGGCSGKSPGGYPGKQPEPPGNALEGASEKLGVYFAKSPVSPEATAPASPTLLATAQRMDLLPLRTLRHETLSGTRHSLRVSRAGSYLAGYRATRGPHTNASSVGAGSTPHKPTRNTRPPCWQTQAGLPDNAP